jgi:hypothetical protein
MVAGSTFGIQSNDQVTLPDDNSHRTIGDFLDGKNYADDYPSYPDLFLATVENTFESMSISFVNSAYRFLPSLCLSAWFSIRALT